METKNTKKTIKLYSANNVAAFLELTPKRIKQLTDEGHLTEVQKGLYRLEDVTKEYIRYLKKQISDKNPSSDLNTERANFVKIKRENEEIDLDYKRGKFHKTDEVEFIVTNMLRAFRSKCMTLPQVILSKIAGETNESVILDIIRQAVAETLSELQDYDNLFKNDKEE